MARFQEHSITVSMSTDGSLTALTTPVRGGSVSSMPTRELLSFCIKI